ncbi:hypothetical protein [Microbacterium oxydans]|uniref:Uncharacterized protein n=1 Tax=Microbacterium oxydans TaxID=82380 RepID=A0A0F0L6A6_9MICO|nr:hypothetical protein [Microbacterium oxydans]KJL28214.1 hypothetical protein RS83_03284 [Microbacterium oxydans]
MEQHPVPGHEALVPPDADIARRYLDEAQAVTERRDRAVDRRALAWLQIANAVIGAVFITAFAWILRDAAPFMPQVVLFAFLVWSQLASGMAQRNGMQWRMSSARWPIIVSGAVLLGVALVFFWLAIWDERLPPITMLIPGTLMLVGLGGYGVFQLVRASHDPRPSRPGRSPLSRGIRWGTIVVGIALGALILLAGAPEGVVTSTLLLLMMLLLLVWILAARSQIGLPVIGAAWRWPHVLTFALAATALLALLVVRTTGTDAGMPVTASIGAAVVGMFSAVSFVHGRDPRD